MAQRTDPVVVRDPEAWRQMAHPTRRRLLAEIAAGPARVADLAARVGEPANRVSFHLRALERHGYVERVPSPTGDGRERWWSSTSPSGFRSDVDSLGGDDAALAASQEVRDASEAEAHAYVAAWFRGLARDEARPMNADLVLRLTPERREELGRRLGELFAEFRGDETAGAGEGEAYAVLILGMRRAALEGEEV